jgi:putative oxidoreductase
LGRRRTDILFLLFSIKHHIFKRIFSNCFEGDFMELLKKYNEQFYLVFRLFIGVLFFIHGVMKFSGAQSPQPLTMFWFAGVIEVLVGTMLTLGLFVSYVAILGAAEMIAAYFIAHFPKGWMPIGQTGNGGEAALLFFAAFLAMVPLGSGKYAVDAFFKKSK